MKPKETGTPLKAKLTLSPIRQFKAFDFETVWLSKSDVLTYDQCPWRFKLSRVDGIKVELSEAMQRGQDFHESVWRLYDRVDKEAIIKGVRTIDEEYRKHLPKGPIYDKFIAIERRRLANASRAEKSTFFPVYKEKYLEDEKLQFSGTIDRVDKTPEGEWIVLDYKTGKFHDWNLRNYRYELAGYKHLIDQSGLLPRKVEFICMVFIKSEDVFFERIKPQTEAAFLRRTKKARGKIKARQFSKKISHLCNYCPYMGVCLSEEEQIT